MTPSYNLGTMRDLVFVVALTLALGTLGSSLRFAGADSGQATFIMADGSVNPSTVPIQRNGNLFTLVGNIHITLYDDGIVIERNNTVLEGADHVLMGPNIAESDFTAGVRIMGGIDNVTIRNLEIEEFAYGVWLNWSRDSAVYGNNLTNDRFGIHMESSLRNLITGNNIYGNKIAGFELLWSYDNNITLNNIYDGVSLPGTLHNNWDDGVSRGNYWSSYNGSDMNHDGVGDQPYIIDPNNVDHYPLMIQQTIIPEFRSALIPSMFMATTLLMASPFKKTKRDRVSR